MCGVLLAAQSVAVSEFGLMPDTRENAVPYVQKALEHCRAKGIPTLVFPKGRYDFWPQHCLEKEYFESNTTDINPKRLAVLIEHFDGLTVEGDGSDFVFHDRMQPFTVDSSSSVTIRNLSIDWDIPLTAQATVLQVTDSFIDLHINAYESPYIIEEDQLVFTGEGWKSLWGFNAMEFEAERRIVVPQTGDRGCIRAGGDYRAEELLKGVVRIHADFERTPAAGNLLVLRHSERDHAGFFIVDSKDVWLDQVDIHHCAGLGVLAQYSENLTFTGVRHIPNEKRGRILAGHDDGFQVSNCRGEVVLKNCGFHALMDDPVNVHGTSVRIDERVDDHTLRCRFMHHQSSGMTWARTGETVGFINSRSLETFATGTVKSCTRESKDVFLLVFEQPLPVRAAEGHALENLTWTCNLSVTDSWFGSNRARGLLVSTPGKVVIAHNVFESSGSAILIAGDANEWYESGAVRDVLITQNIFRSPCLTSMYQFCEGVISILPIIPEKEVKKPFHRNIVITGNEFHLYDYPVLYALSVDGIEFSNNRLVRSDDFEPFHRNRDGLTFEYCRKISVTGNVFEGDVRGKTVKLVHTPRREYQTDRNTPFILTRNK
jgi:hypothetical protein